MLTGPPLKQWLEEGKLQIRGRPCWKQCESSDLFTAAEVTHTHEGRGRGEIEKRSGGKGKEWEKAAGESEGQTNERGRVGELK